MFLINTASKDTICYQIKSQILRFIDIGVLHENDKLPSVRELAKELGINPNTVQKAYSELEAENVIYTLNKKGAFVASAATVDAQEKEIEKIVSALKSEKCYTKQQWLEAIENIYKEG